jgi:DNA polymerase III alpha subunit
VAAREKHNGYTTLRDLAAGISEAELSSRQIEVLVLSGACDGLGGRDAVLAALLGAAQEQKEPPGELAHEPAPGPRLRYARHAWELDNLGVGFTNAHDMDALKRALSAGSDWSGRLTGSARLGTGQVGQSVYLVGLLHYVRQLGVEVRTPNEGKSGQEEKVAVAWVEDLDGAIELVAFPPNYKRHAALWTENNMVIVTARVRAHSDGEGVYLLCEHMAPYNVAVEEQEINITIKANKRAASVAGEETTPLPTPEPAPTNGGSHKVAPTPQDVMQDTRIEIQNPKLALERSEGSKIQNEEEPGYELIITLPSSSDDHEDIDRMIKLDRLLKGHRGPDTVILRIPYSPETGSYTKAQLPRGVRYSSVLEMEIRDLLGPDALALIKLLG